LHLRKEHFKEFALTGASVVDSVPLETAALLQVDATPAVAAPEAVLLKRQFKQAL
jgi:hypothetical protein